MRRITVACYRRHSAKCNDHEKCRCPVWMRWSKGGQFREPAHTGTWGIAEQKAAALEKRLNSDEEEPVRNVDDDRTIDAAIKSFTLRMCGAVTKSVIAKYNTELPRFNEFMERRDKHYPGEITKDDLVDYRAELDERYGSNLTKKMYQARLKSFLRFADVSERLISYKLGGALRSFKIPKSKPDPFDEGELARLFAAIPKVFRGYPRKAARVATLIRFMVSTGCSIADTLLLERSNIADGWLRIERKKTGKPVRQKLDVALLAELNETANGNTRHVFLESNFETARSNMLRDIRRLMKAANVYTKGNLSHRFRDTAARFWYDNGQSSTVVAELLGDNESTVEKYYKDWSGDPDRIAQAPQRRWL